MLNKRIQTKLKLIVPTIQSIYNKNQPIIPFFQQKRYQTTFNSNPIETNNLLKENTFKKEYQHIPVLLDEVLSLSEKLVNKEGWVLDLTFGFGGYTKALLDKYPKIKVIAMDQDPLAFFRAYKMATSNQYKGRLLPILGKFGSIQAHLDGLKEINHILLEEFNINESPQKVDLMVMDVGVSSEQLDNPALGFSFTKSGKLDMRMCQPFKGELPKSQYCQIQSELHNSMVTNKTLTAHHVVNYFSKEVLADIFKQYGEERHSKRIANAIEIYRQSQQIDTTDQLSDIICKISPKHIRPNSIYRPNIHPATRTFQALRIYVNDELIQLQSALNSCSMLLQPNGLLLGITFHSLEDRILKRFIKQQTSATSSSSNRIQTKTEMEQIEKIMKRNRKFKHGKKLNKLLYEEDWDDDVIEEEYTLDDDEMGRELQECAFYMDKPKSQTLIRPNDEELDRNPRARSAKLRYAFKSP